MQIYLPIAEIPVNVILILGLGLFAGLLSGIFGIGGGFIATPLLIFIGIPPVVAVATSTNQIISASASGVLAHLKKGSVDIKIGSVFVIGGMIGSTIGVSIFKALQKGGYIDITIPLIYVILLGSISVSMLKKDIFLFLTEKMKVNIKQSSTPNLILDKLLKKIDTMPWKIYFPKSDIKISVLALIILSSMVGCLVALMGVGGGFLMIPAMLYIFKMPANIVVGTSLFQIIFVASNATFLQAITSNNVDIILACLMIVSSAIGAQFGSRISYKMKPEKMKFILALLLLMVCIKMFTTLFAEPTNLYSIEVLAK